MKKNIEDGLGHKNLGMTTAKYISDPKKYRNELVDKSENNTTEIFRQRISYQSNHEL